MARPSPELCKALRYQLTDALNRIVGRAEASRRCIILSGGVDTCAILACAKDSGITFDGAITVLTGEESPDLEFAKAAAEEAQLEHHILMLTADDLIDSFLPACVSHLGTFDGMTLRNSLVVAAAMRKANELGFRHAIVGDGADELFGGYSFMWGGADDPSQWKERRDKMCKEWTFATSALAELYGLESSDSPFTEPSFVEWALANVHREDCIGDRPIRLTLKGDRIEHTTGKLVLREAYDTISSWRRKDPIEVGSGVSIIAKDAFWAQYVSDDELQEELANMHVRGYDLKNKEHLVNFRAFERAFGVDGLQLARKKRLPLGKGCAGCCFEIGEATFCDVCGAYPAQREN